MPHRVGGPIPEHSRVGRDKQRYGETGGRMVAGTVPVRVLSENDNDSVEPHETDVKLTAENVRVLLVTSRSGAGLVFPKGGWETDESCEAAAARETVEEAGVRGDLEPEPLGTFKFASSKKKKEKKVNCSHGNKDDECTSASASVDGSSNSGSEAQATMFALRVREELVTWPEARQRCRVWLSPGDALAACKHEWMREALRSWAERHGIGGGGSGRGKEEEESNGSDVTASTSAAEIPPLLQPSPGGRERAAAAAVAAAKAAGLSVVPWIKIAGEEEEGEGGGGGGGGGGTMTAAATAAATSK